MDAVNVTSGTGNAFPKDTGNSQHNRGGFVMPMLRRMQKNCVPVLQHALTRHT